MKRYTKAKVYDAAGMLQRSGVTVTVDNDNDCVMIGGTCHPISELTFDDAGRTIASPNGWEVAY